MHNFGDFERDKEIRRLKYEVEQGTYHVSAEDVAAAMLARESEAEQARRAMKAMLLMDAQRMIEAEDWDCDGEGQT